MTDASKCIGTTHQNCQVCFRKIHIDPNDYRGLSYSSIKPEINLLNGSCRNFISSIFTQ